MKNRIKNLFLEEKYILTLFIFEIICILISFYPFYKWEKYIRTTNLNLIINTELSPYATFSLVIAYYILNFMLFRSLLKIPKNHNKFLEKEINEYFKELTELRKDYDKLKIENEELKNKEK
ncbi:MULTISPECIES: hypothetical protein [Bacteria]|uniref:hypothetical protein n=1 Tax=Bacteria TaxID=2 RepID=UPI003F3DCA04